MFEIYFVTMKRAEFKWKLTRLLKNIKTIKQLIKDYEQMRGLIREFKSLDINRRSEQLQCQ